MKKRIIISIILIASCLFSSPALAIILAPHSEEMYEESACGRSGNIDIYFSAEDIFDINSILSDGTSQYVLLRFTLSGTDINPTANPPVLCADIQVDSDGDTVDANPGIDFTDADDFQFTNPAAIWTNVVSLATIGSEVSDGVGDGSGITEPPNGMADITAFVHGTSGNQYFEVVIYGLDPDIIPSALPAPYSSDYTTWPRLTVGLYATDEGIAIDDEESHAICTDVSGFSYLSKLEVSLDTWPNSVTFTPGDDQIGHFLSEINTVGCNPNDSGIMLCNSVYEAPHSDCESYQGCFVASGDWPDNDIHVAIGTNQNGVYLQSVTWENSSNFTSGSLSLFQDELLTTPADGGCSFESKYANGIIDASSLPYNGSDNLELCITYTLDTSVQVETPVYFTATANTLPCGNVFDETVLHLPVGAKLKRLVLTDLMALIPSGNRKVDLKIEKAIEKINQSLGDDLWEDEAHLTKKGKRVFNNDKEAAMKLAKVHTPNVWPQLYSLVSVDEHLAIVALQEAMAAAEASGCDGSQKRGQCREALRMITNAREEMATIINCYKRVWSRAYKAINKLDVSD